MTYAELEDFISKKMRMSHIYQPAMLMELMKHGGSVSEEQIGRALLARDTSQVEYYSIVTRDMVGRVLRKHGVVTRDSKTKTYELAGYEGLTPKEIENLNALLQAKLRSFEEAHGGSVWDHRRKGGSHVSGTLRYEILKDAQGRCELCGISKDEKHLQVDHIVPRNHGGSDDPSNLQALCYSCNAMKRDRDDTDFRVFRELLDHAEPDCVFCNIDSERVIEEEPLARVIRDAYPVTDLHTLIVPRRHVASYFELGRPELNACNRLLAAQRERIQERNTDISGFNVGINDGASAGQTVGHCHIHLIPRRKGDVKDSRGGVRGVIPGKQDYIESGGDG